MTLNEYRKKQAEILAKDGAQWEKANAGRITWEAYSKVTAKTDKAQDYLKDVMLADPKVARYVCNRTITFQATASHSGQHLAALGMRDNHLLGDLLQAAFPRGLDDSEAGQGFFYINERYVPKVLEFLKDKATDVDVDATEGLLIGRPQKRKQTSR